MDSGRDNLSRLVVAVDLLPLRPGGENGGLKPAIFTLLRAVRAAAQDKLIFVFLTNSASHLQVRDLAAPEDILICLLEETAQPFDEFKTREGDFRLVPVPPNLVQELGVDLLYCPFGATTFHVPGIPTIALIADLLHKDYPFTLTEHQIAEREAYLQKTMRDATLLQSISRSGMERVMEHYRVPRERLFYTYLPIHGRLESIRAEGTASAKPPTTLPFFFYPANLWLHKNHEVLLLSYARYCQGAGEEAWDLVLTFHEEPRAEYLKALAEVLDIADKVHFLGFLDEADLHQIWAGAGALVFPSLHEGFGIPLLEAMHYGVPIITSQEFALREVAGDACYPVDPRKPASLSEALQEVSRNEELRAKLAGLGRQRVNLFDVTAAAHILFKAFCSVVHSEDDLPRKPRYCHVPPLLSTLTPGSALRWEIDIRFQASASSPACSIYLDDVPFASFHPAGCPEQKFSFVCRPEGRTLALRRSPGDDSNGNGRWNGDEVLITKIVAREEQGDRILLYESSPRQRSHEG